MSDDEYIDLMIKYKALHQTEQDLLKIKNYRNYITSKPKDVVSDEERLWLLAYDGFEAMLASNKDLDVKTKKGKEKYISDFSNGIMALLVSIKNF